MPDVWEPPQLVLMPTGDDAPSSSDPPPYGFEHLRQVVDHLERQAAGRPTLTVVKGGCDDA